MVASARGCDPTLNPCGIGTQSKLADKDLRRGLSAEGGSARRAEGLSRPPNHRKKSEPYRSATIR